MNKFIYFVEKYCEIQEVKGNYKIYSKYSKTLIYMIKLDD